MCFVNVLSEKKIWSTNEEKKRTSHLSRSRSLYVSLSVLIIFEALSIVAQASFSCAGN